MKKSRSASKLSLNIKKVAVPVSYRLQLATVIAVVFASLAQFTFLISMFRHGPSGGIFSGSTFPLLAYNFFPLIIFLIAYFTSARYPLAINRWFIAVVKSVIFMSLFGFLQGIRSLATQLFYRPDSYQTGAPPAWVINPWIDFGVIGICVFGMLVIFILQRKKLI